MKVFHTVLVRSELVAAVNDRYFFCDWLKHKRPVNRGISTAKDRNASAGEFLQIINEVMEVFAFILLGIFKFQLSRFECAVSCSYDDRFRVVGFFICYKLAWSFSTRLSLWHGHGKGANKMAQNEEKTPKSQKIQDRIIMAMIWVVAALVIALVVGTALNYINIFK